MGSKFFEIQGPFRTTRHTGHKTKISQKLFRLHLERAKTITVYARYGFGFFVGVDDLFFHHAVELGEPFDFLALRVAVEFQGIQPAQRFLNGQWNSSYLKNGSFSAPILFIRLSGCSMSYPRYAGPEFPGP